MKTCNKCGIQKTLSEFYARKPSGYRSACKECYLEKGRNDYTDNIDKNRARSAKYRAEHRNERNAAFRKYYAANRERVILRTALYKSENPHVAKASKAKRRAIEASLPNDVTSSDIQRIFERYDGLCAISGKKAEHLDHFIPLATGIGGNTIGNLIPLSAELNLSKQARNPFEWAQDLDEASAEQFSEVVAYLADLNGFTVEEYEAHVYNCFD